MVCQYILILNITFFKKIYVLMFNYIFRWLWALCSLYKGIFCIVKVPSKPLESPRNARISHKPFKAYTKLYITSFKRGNV